jgi:hypothetical protein
VLKRYFASQSLAGGYYLHRRFRSQEKYSPWLLTDPGSVFLLKIVQPNDAKQVSLVQELIERWYFSGLPPYDSSLEWRNCPYVRENGYGEIAVNLMCHWHDQPEKGSFNEICIPEALVD